MIIYVISMQSVFAINFRKEGKKANRTLKLNAVDDGSKPIALIRSLALKEFNSSLAKMNIGEDYILQKTSLVTRYYL